MVKTMNNIVPSKEIPEEMYNGYTMDGLVKITYKYGNDCDPAIQEEINNNFRLEVFEYLKKKVARRDENYYGKTDRWLYNALEKYPIEGLDLCIIGSTSPWYETIALAFGAKKVTVIEYSDRKSFHKDIVYIKPGEVGDKKFDAGFSISSVEHDGLGRYGDPLDPDGDLKAMINLKKNIKQDGLLYFSVPTGYDKVVFNVHRVYGEHRFPALIKGWQEEDRFGCFPIVFKNDVNNEHGTPYQPVFVLKNI